MSHTVWLIQMTHLYLSFNQTNDSTTAADEIRTTEAAAKDRFQCVWCDSGTRCNVFKVSTRFNSRYTQYGNPIFSNTNDYSHVTIICHMIQHSWFNPETWLISGFESSESLSRIARRVKWLWTGLLRRISKFSFHLVPLLSSTPLLHNTTLRWYNWLHSCYHSRACQNQLILNPEPPNWLITDKWLINYESCFTTDSIMHEQTAWALKHHLPL